MIITKDDFYPEGLLIEEVKKARSADYEDYRSQGLTYPGISVDTSDTFTVKLLQHVLGEKVTANIPPFFRSYTSTDTQPTYIHTDIDAGTFTAIIFLNTQINGGVAFWQHKLTKRTQASKFDRRDTLKRYNDDTQDESQWELITTVEAKLNRLVLFSSASFHSRYPKNGWTSELGDVRLIKVVFLRRQK